MQYMKLSTSRDFRINASVLDSALQEQNSEDAENEPHNDQVRTHLAAFTDSFPPLKKPAVFVSCAGMCEVRTACLPRVSSHFNTKLTGRREQFLSEHPLHSSPLPQAAFIFMHQLCVPGLGEVKLLARIRPLQHDAKWFCMPVLVDKDPPGEILQGIILLRPISTAQCW